MSSLPISEISSSGSGSGYIPFADNFAQISLQRVIPSYLYLEYNDDESLQAFVAAFNQLAQAYVTWFNQIGLPVYTGPWIVTGLLDWIAQGLYGVSRPTLSSGKNRYLGTLNTMTPGQFIPIDGTKIVGPGDLYLTSDDVFKRIITWKFYKGDGKIFSVRWLKRRIMRFLIGVNGTAPNVDETYRISVNFADDAINIIVFNTVRTIVGGAIPGVMSIGSVAPNELITTVVRDPPFDQALALKEAIEAGVLDLPFQFTYTVTII